MKLDKLDALPEFKQFQVREITDSGSFHRRVINPDEDVSGEDEQIQEQAEKLWTNEVKDKWAIKQEESKAEIEALKNKKE